MCIYGQKILGCKVRRRGLKDRGNDAHDKPFGLWSGRAEQSEPKPLRLAAEPDTKRTSGRIVAVGFNPREQRRRAVSLLAMAVLLFTVIACEEEKKNSCIANVDCPGVEACVAGRCISDTAKCEVIGAFADITGVAPLRVNSVHEMHTFVDDGGATHYCYYGEFNGQFIGRYVRQVAWDSFEEEPLIGADGAPVRCGALTVTSDGTTVVFSRAPAAVLLRQVKGSWPMFALDGLEGVEAQGAINGNRALISLTPDAGQGVYLGLSLGYDLSSQAVYLAHVTPAGLEVLSNGWSENGTHTDIGHAPQIIASGAAGEALLVNGNVVEFSVHLSDLSFATADTVEGLHPRVAAAADGTSLVLYLDRNYRLLLDDVSDGEFSEFVSLGEVGIDEFGSDGQLPWDMRLDANGMAHLLIEDWVQGTNTLVYRTVNAQGEVSPLTIVTNSLVGGLPGMQRYALSTDICGRATVARFELNPNGSTPVLKVVEWR